MRGRFGSTRRVSMYGVRCICVLFLFLMQVEMATSSESGVTIVCLLGKTTIACTAILYMRTDEVVNEEGDR